MNIVNKSVIGTVVLAAGGASSSLANINYSNFDSTAGLTINSVAVQSDGASGETHKTISITPPGGNSAGTVWANQQQSIVNGFTAQFTFRMREKVGTGADGIAFVIQNDPRGTSAIGGRGGAMGYSSNPFFPTDAGPGLKNSMAVVFDTFDNSGDWASIPGTNIITVQMASGPNLANKPSLDASIGHVTAGVAFNDGNIHTVTIAYIPGQLKVFYDTAGPATLTAAVDLSTQVALNNGSAFVGFTGATGDAQNSQRQEILSWSLTSGIPAPTTATLMGVGGLCAARRRRRV